jgi:hypothetical protein
MTSIVGNWIAESTCATTSVAANTISGATTCALPEARAPPDSSCTAPITAAVANAVNAGMTTCASWITP